MVWRSAATSKVWSLLTGCVSTRTANCSIRFSRLQAKTLQSPLESKRWCCRRCCVGSARILSYLRQGYGSRCRCWCRGRSRYAGAWRRSGENGGSQLVGCLGRGQNGRRTFHFVGGRTFERSFICDDNIEVAVSLERAWQFGICDQTNIEVLAVSSGHRTVVNAIAIYVRT